MTKKGRPIGSKNKASLKRHKVVSFTLSEDIIMYLEKKREEGFIKSRVIETAIRDYIKNNN